MSENKRLSGPILEWLEDRVPLNRQFDDTYYTRSDGLAETRYVFLDGNRLIERFRTADRFRIGELGFGTGLNFLATVALWLKVAPENAELEYHSLEAYPITQDEMANALARWPEFGDIAKSLTKNWWGSEGKPNERTFHLAFEKNISLSVSLLHADNALHHFPFQIDAWFLDGFSPSKNPEMWSTSLLKTVHELTRENGTFATYTAAGWVRRNLEAAGFRVDRRPGFAGKRQMMIGTKS